MKILMTLLVCTTAIATGQVPATPPEEAVTNIRVVASEMVWVGILSGGIKVTGVINGQPLVLREFKEKNPIAPGSYAIGLTRNDNPHGSESDQRYTLKLQDGKELTFYLEALCEREASVCYGVSLK